MEEISKTTVLTPCVRSNPDILFFPGIGSLFSSGVERRSCKAKVGGAIPPKGNLGNRL